MQAMSAMVTVLTYRAEPVPRRPAWLDGKLKRRLLNSPGGTSATHNVCASLSLATREN